MSADQLNSFLEKLDLLCAKLKEEDCPICDLKLTGDKTSCVNGHGICISCKLVVRICPLCSANYPSDLAGNVNIPSNDTLGEVADQKKCTNAVRGCQTCLPESEIKQHEESCSFRLYACKICNVEMCMRKLRVHCERSHRAEIIKNSSFHEVKDHETLNGSRYYFIDVNNEFFWFWRNNTFNLVFFGLQCLGDSSRSSKFKYKLEVVSKDNKCVMKFGGPVLFDTPEIPMYGPTEDYVMVGKNFLSSGTKFKLSVHTL